jgi:hypothetical protein
VHRRSVLLPAWQLAVTLHPELARRVGTPQLALPGRRLEGIGAVERGLATRPDDPAIWELKRVLYSGLTESEYFSVAKDVPLPDFDYGYAQQLGLALIGEQARWLRGCEYLRIAAHGLPLHGPSIFTQIAQAQQNAGQSEDARHSLEHARQAGRAVGPKGLPDVERHCYFAAVKQLAEDALARNDLAAAIENFRLFSEYERSGLETLRNLADLCERHGDPLSALLATERALVYNSGDKDLAGRKDKYYYSVMPDFLRGQPENVKNAIDIEYCLRKSKSLLDVKEGDLELLDWANHLAELALVVRPASLAAKTLLARARLRRGERDEAVRMLEEVREPKPEKFVSTDDEDAWFQSCRLLGNLYLNELGQPDRAVPCFQDYRKCSKSGADTLFKLAQAYEQLGDGARATKFYEHVIAYDNHPLAPEAQDAIYRLQVR